MSYTERKIVEMLRNEIFAHPFVLEIIRRIEAGEHLTKAGARTTRVMSAAEIQAQLRRAA